jgi:hypothetical protein
MKIDLNELSNSSRTQDGNGTMKVLRHNAPVFFSWGGHGFTMINNKVLKFSVNGHHHKGHVYVVVNGSDLYDVYLTTSHKNIVKEMKDIYFDELQDRIDCAIERVDSYI